MLMSRKIVLILLAVLCAFTPLWADDTTQTAADSELTGTWWYDRTIDGFSYVGLQHVEARTLNNLLRPYIGQTFTPELESEISNLLYAQPWLEYVAGFNMVLNPATGGITIEISLHELTLVTEVAFAGNNEINARTLTDEQGIQTGDYFSPGLLRANSAMVQQYYYSRGFAEATVSAYSEINDENNTVRIVYEINEGPQYKIESINFTGNAAFSAKELKKEMTSKERSFFRSL